MACTNNLEPQAFGLITFNTTFGDIDIELFTKQCPRLTRKFVQYCLNGFYQGKTFYRVEKDFIAVAGDPNGEDKIMQHDFCPDEFNSRLRFSRRGLLATANLKKDKNGSEIFFTLGATPELQNKHSIFGRVIGSSIFNLVELNECQVDEDLKPCSERKITRVIVINNPYPDLIPVIDRSTSSPKELEDFSSDLNDPLLKPKLSGKNSKKLSFYPTDDEEDELKDEDEASTYEANHSRDSKESQSRIVTEERVNIETFSTNEQLGDKEICLNKQESETEKERLSKKRPNEKEQRLREIRAQILSIKTQIEQEAETKTLSERRKETNSTDLHTSSSSSREISAISHKASKKSRHRSYETIEMVTNFKKRLREASKKDTLDSKSCDEISEGELEMDELSALEKMDSDRWLKHRFEPKDDIIIAKDANSKDNSWYSVDDPRHSMNRRHSSRSHRDHSRHKSSRHRT